MPGSNPRITSMQKSKPNSPEKVKGIHAIPAELFNVIFYYMRTEELIASVQLVIKKWNKMVQSQYLWKTLEESNPLTFEHKYLKQKKLVERRSKGKLFIATNRVNGETCVVRKVFLDVTNAGKDDGVPTSALREISYLTSLSSPYVGTVIEAQVKDNLLYLAYPYHKYNLREYMKLYIESTPSIPLADKGVKYKMPLSKIKVYIQLHRNYRN
jgi:hypothetical protein